jgi:hypothetical protein
MADRARSLAVLLVVMAAVPALLRPQECLAAEVTVQVTQIKASNEGGESVDPALRDLGERVKKQYPYRNFKLVGTASHPAGEERAAEFQLANGMTLAAKLLSVRGNNIELDVSISQGTRPLPSFKVKVVSGGTFLTSFPWGKDLLILALRPTAR